MTTGWRSILSAVALAGLSARAAVVINEVCYSNSSVPDETGDTSSDWIELYNSGPSAVNLGGYRLGDQSPFIDSGHGVVLTNYTLPAGGHFVVFVGGDSDRTAWTNAPDVALIASNSLWRYYVSGTALASSWKTNTFSDAGWSVGMSPLGYNDNSANMDCATVLGYGGTPSSRNVTTYFRNSFRALNPATVTGLVVNARINDGAVIYLNGREVWRYNMPAGAVTNSTLATQTLSPTLWTSTALSTNGLLLGTNVVAVEVHQASASSADMVLDLSLTALVNERVPITHGDFGLKSDFSENVHLWDSSGTKLQKFEPPSGAILPDVNQTYGACPDGDTTTFKVYDSPTPGAANSTAPSELLTGEKPAFSKAPGIYAESQSVTLTSATAGYKIQYSVNGSDPRYSPLYVYSGNAITVSNVPSASSGLAWIRTNPVEITNGVPTAGWCAPSESVRRALVLRAVTLSADGLYCSPETRGTYFVGPEFTNRTLPIVALNTDTNNLFGFVSGIYAPGKCYADSSEGYGSNKWGKPHANYHQDSVNEEWEHPSLFELFEPSQTTASVAQVLGTAMYGGGTRALPQKTLYMIARAEEYGSDRVFHALFPAESSTSYKRFLLRNSGNDWYGPDNAGVATMMKDAAFQQIIRHLNISTMAYRPAVAYVNGVYWGIHNLRESYDKHYLSTRYGIDPDNADILMHEEDPADSTKVIITRVDGSKSADDDFEALLDWVQTNSLSVAANYQAAVAQVDVTNYIDYIAAETFFSNTDWPINNCDFWRAHTNETGACGQYGDQRWRWMLYDLDLAGAKGSDYNMLEYLDSSKMTGRHEPAFLFSELRQNASFRFAFIKRYANLLNTAFRPERMTALIAQSADAIAPEIETHFRRWGRPYTQAQWRQAVTNTLFDFVVARHTASWIHLNTFFSLGGSGSLLVSNVTASGIGGHFVVNDIDIETTTDGVTNRASWSGTFFQNFVVPVQAIPDSGYVFDGWVGSAEVSAARSVYVGNSPTRLVARFRLASALAHVASGYEQWQLRNYSEQEILDGVTAAADTASGYAGLSNFGLYAFGMSRTDGLTDAQRLARASLSISTTNSALWIGYSRLNASHSDVQYTLQAASSLSATTAWHTVVLGSDVQGNTITSVLDSATWFLESQLPSSTSTNWMRFYKLQVLQP